VNKVYDLFIFIYLFI